MADDKKKAEKRNSDPATIKCKVHRQNTDPQNALVPITVNAVGRANGKKVFIPGTVVNLTQAQANILRDSAEEHEHKIPDESGIYQSANPVKTAADYYPGCEISQDQRTGRLTAYKKVPHYIIERL